MASKMIFGQNIDFWDSLYFVVSVSCLILPQRLPFEDMPCLLASSLGKNRAVCGRYTALESCSYYCVASFSITWNASQDLVRLKPFPSHRFSMLHTSLPYLTAFRRHTGLLLFKIRGLKLKRQNTELILLFLKVR